MATTKSEPVSEAEKQRIVDGFNRLCGTTLPVAIVEVAVEAGLQSWERLAKELKDNDASA